MMSWTNMTLAALSSASPVDMMAQNMPMTTRPLSPAGMVSFINLGSAMLDSISG